MSYNISAWHQIECSLIFPESILREEHPAIRAVQIDEPVLVDGGMDARVTIYLDAIGDGRIVGKLHNHQLFVDEVSLTGEGSHTCYEHLEDLLTDADGTYSALLVWAEGDSISLLEVTEDEVRGTDQDLVAIVKAAGQAQTLYNELYDVLMGELTAIEWCDKLRERFPDLEKNRPKGSV